MPMPLIINNRNELNASPLIINGRKLHGISENKTIWSYKPDDRRVKLPDNEDEEVHENVRSLTSIDTFSYSLKKINDDTSIFDMIPVISTLKSNSNNNVDAQTTTPLINSSTSSASALATKATPIPINTNLTTPNKLIEHYRVLSASNKFKSNENHAEANETSQISNATLSNEELFAIRYNNYRESLSRLLKQKYEPQRENVANEYAQTSSMNESDTKKSNRANEVVYSNQIDTLSSELMAAFTFGKNSGKLYQTQQRNHNHHHHQQQQQQQENVHTNSFYNQHSKNAIELLEDDEDAYIDDYEMNDEIEDDDDYNLVYDEDDDYEDDRFILDTNVNEKRNHRGHTNNSDSNLVMKICNENFKSRNSFTSSNNNINGRGAKTKPSRSQLFTSNNASLNTQQGIKANYMNNNECSNEYPSAYFDPNVDDYDYEYEYTEVLNEDLRDMFNRYDGSVTAESFSKIHSSSLNELNGESHTSTNKKFAQEMLNLTKRMMVKKKYELATIKLERENARKLKSKRSSIKSRPSTAANSLPFETLKRPKSVSIIALKQNASTSNLNETNNYNYNTNNEESSEVFYTATNNQLSKEDENNYEPFKLCQPAIAYQTWPYEIDFENKPQTNNNNKKSKSNKKCNSCKKFPIVTNNNVNNSNNNTNQKDNWNDLNKFTSESNSVQNATTFATSRRILSARLLNRKLIGSAKTINSTTSTGTLTGGLLVNEDFNDDSNMNQSTSDMENNEKTFENMDDYEDLMQHNRNLSVNKHEQMKKMTILPGKTFRSQRFKSISNDHVPASQRKLENQKIKLQQQQQQTSQQQNLKTPLSNKQTLVQQIHLQLKRNKSNLEQTEKVKIIAKLDTNTGMNTSSNAIINMNNSNLNISSSNNSTKTLMKKNITPLAIQHHEEIYSLVDNKKTDLTQLNKNIFSNKSLLAKKNGITNITSLIAKKTLLNDYYLIENSNNTSNNYKRPKTSKT